MNPVLSTALSGLMASTGRLGASAARTASPNADLVAETVQQITARDDFQANAAVLKTAFQMDRTLLDMKI